ncbi:hypothetical protein DL95DRAFT_465419 [Leptodontidium sp. 2 PMI_412]|nr:hypothetical protein DL95DRAFT_465419 [Leptodontidium sp. 2 PMI_412]
MEHQSFIYTSPPTMGALDFEWNVFENQQQFLTWHNQPPTSHILTHTHISPSDSISNTNTNSIFRSYANSSTHHTEAESQSSASSVAGEKSEDLDLDLDLELGLEFGEGGCKKAPTRRRIQNRKAQRAFRLRQKMHVESLEERLKTLVREYEALQQRYTCLSVEYEKIVRGRGSGSSDCMNGSVDGSGSLKSEWINEDDIDVEGLEDCEGEKDDDVVTEVEDEKEKAIRVDWRNGEQDIAQSGKGLYLHDFLLGDAWAS